MVTRITVPKSCLKQLSIIGWVLHGAGILFVIISLSSSHWLKRVSNGNHVGILPCCPKFQCGTSMISSNDRNINAFSEIIVVGILIVGLGWILSLTHACVTWRNDKRTLFGLSYLASGLVTVGGITLLAASIEFIANIPGDMEDALRKNCNMQDNSVVTGYSYALFLTGAVSFILAGILLLLGNPMHSSTDFQTRSDTRPSGARRERSHNIHLQTVASRLTSRGLPCFTRPSTTSFENPLCNDAVTGDHLELGTGITPRTLPNYHPQYTSTSDILQLTVRPPSYEYIRDSFSCQVENPSMDESEFNNSTDGYSSSFRSSPTLVHLPAYDDILKDQPPLYTDAS